MPVYNAPPRAGSVLLDLWHLRLGVRRLWAVFVIDRRPPYIGGAARSVINVLAVTLSRWII